MYSAYEEYYHYIEGDYIKEILISVGLLNLYVFFDWLFFVSIKNRIEVHLKMVQANVFIIPKTFTLISGLLANIGYPFLAFYLSNRINNKSKDKLKKIESAIDQISFDIGITKSYANISNFLHTFEQIFFDHKLLNYILDTNQSFYSDNMIKNIIKDLTLFVNYNQITTYKKANINKFCIPKKDKTKPLEECQAINIIFE